MANDERDDGREDDDEGDELPPLSEEEKARLRAKFGWEAGDITVTPPPAPDTDPDRPWKPLRPAD